MNRQSSPTYPHLQQSHFPPDRIGWKQLFVGRFMFEWSNLQQHYLVLQSIVSKKYLGTSWITGVIQIIWNHVYYNWEARNADLHGIDVATRKSAQYAQAQRETEISTCNALLSSLKIGMYFTSIPTNTSKKNPWLVG